jgi:AcrR family transcriptional regulator
MNSQPKNMRVSSQSTSDDLEAGIRTPKLRRGKARVAALMEAAAAVFAEKGYDGATMTEIAAKAGAAIGSLYQFFPTKELLATALHDEQLGALSQMFEAMRDGPAATTAAEAADRLFGGLSEFLVHHPAFVALAERRAVDKTRKRVTRTLMQHQIAALLTRASPALPPGRSEVMAMVILQLLKATVAISGSDDARTRDAALAELRQMLRTHLEAVDIA